MDAEKSELLLQIEKLKSEQRSQEVICKKLVLDLSTKQNDALALSSQFSNVTWKITQADFILNHEKERHEKKLKMMENSRNLLSLRSSSGIIDSAEIGEFEKYNEVITGLGEEKNLLLDRIQDLQNFNNEAKISVTNSRQVITILKKKNAAIMLKLQKRFQEAENEEKTLTLHLDHLQEKYLEKIQLK